MKRFLSLALMIVLMLSLALTSCGRKQVKDIQITSGFKYEYELNETPDFSGVKATIVYNDGTTKEVNADELTFGALDTSTSGKKDLEISYGSFTTSVEVNVKSKSIVGDNKELVSIKYVSGIPENVYVGDEISFNSIVIIATYSDGSEETKTASNTAVKHNGADISTATAGEKTLTITFMGKSCSYVFNVQEIVVVGLAVTQANLNVIEGTEFDPTDMKVDKIFNNGERINVSLDELTITQNGNIVTVAYGNVSTTLTLNVEDATVTTLTLNTASFTNKILVGDSVNTSTISITGTLNNGLSENVPHTDVTFSSVDTSAPGTYTITVSYNADTTITASVDVTVLGIKSITIDASTIATFFPAGTAFDHSGLKVNVTASDDSVLLGKGIADGVSVDVSNLNTDAIGQYNITASYRGVTSAQQTITVHDPDLSYVILDVDLPMSLSSWETKRGGATFKVHDNPYVVGDDNPYIFKLTLTVLDGNGNLNEAFDSYKSYFEVWQNGAELTEAQYTEYVEAIDPANNSIDFTTAAIGQTFTIKTRPADGISDADAENMTREHTVKIVDGLNIYEAWELNYLTNYNDFDLANEIDGDGGETRTVVQIVLDFLKNNKGVALDAPKSLAGIVLHNDMDVKKSDLPSEFFHSSGDFYDYLTVFPHATDKNNPTFTFYGNYYTVLSYDLPNVVGKDVANNDDSVSSAQLFRFSCAELNDTNFRVEDYKTRLENVAFRDNNPNKNNEATANRDMLGIIAMKVQFQQIEVENINITAYYIGFFLDNDYTVATVNNSIFYNGYQNLIYSYNKNPLGEDDAAPAANHVPITLNITNSSVTKCGGPVILNQTENPGYARHSKSGAQVTIDDKTEIWTWVTGQEAWFKAIGAQPIATQLAGLGLLLAEGGMPKTFVSTTGENGLTGESGEYFMNMVMVNIVSGTDIQTVLTFADDLDGKLTVGEKTYLDMNDTVTLPDGVHGYGSANVATQFGTQAAAGKEPVIINTYTDGTLVIDKVNQTATPAGSTEAEMYQNMQKLADGDMVAIYYGCFGFVFGYQPFNGATSNQ